MIPSSNKFIEAVNQNHRRWYSRILCNGVEVTGSVRSWVVDKGSCGKGSLKPQSIFSNYANITIDNCKTYLKGKKIEIQSGIQYGSEILWITEAVLYANDQIEKGKTTTIPCLGVLSAKLGKNFYGGTYTTISSLLSRISEVAGCQIILDDGLNDLPIPSVDLSKYLYREVLQMVAGCYFGFVTETYDGNICIKTLKSNGEIVTASLSRMADYPDFYEEATVEGIQVITAEDEELIVGTLQNCSLTNPLMTAEAFNTYKSNYVGYTYQAHNTELTLGNPAIEPWDFLSIQDEKGVTHTLPCMSIRNTFDGGLRTTVSAPTISSGEDFSRDEVKMQSNTAYNAVISGNIETNGGGGGSSPTAAAYPITGDGISGYLYIENGSRVFGNLHIQISEGDIVGASSVGISGYSQSAMISKTVVDNTIYFNKPLEIPYSEYLGPNYAYELNGLHVMIPTFTYNGEIYTGAGALNAWVNLYLNSSSRSLSYVLNFSTEYMKELLGDLYVYDSTIWDYKSLIGASFDLHFTYLIGTSREWEYPNT